MSISTSSFCSARGCSCADVKQSSPRVQQAWANVLLNRIHVLDGVSVDWYLDNLVPSNIAYAPSDDVKEKPGPFSEYRPVQGQELDSYPGLLGGMENLVVSLPKDRRLKFVDTHDAPIPFPFPDFADHHHRSKPDVSVSFPGEPLDKVGPWQEIALVMEVKSERNDDPFLDWKAGKAPNDVIIQIARNGRNLMLTHGFLYSFVLGIYGNYVRIVRFDHACALVSKRFSLRQNPELLQKFFYHFVHPHIRGSSVVGSDPSVSRLKLQDERWVEQELEKRGDYDPKTFAKNISTARRRLVYDHEDKPHAHFITYEILDVNARLFSRATMVSRAIEDTRFEGQSGRARKDPKVTPRIGVLKESWRQVVRKSEAEFYRRLAERIPEDQRFGLTKLVCGGDIGQIDVREWESTSPEASHIMGEQRNLRLPPMQLLSTADISSARSDSGTSASTLVDDAPSSDDKDADSSRYPLPFPQHQTFSWTIALDSGSTYRERSHMRFVVADVGRPPTDFKNSKELVASFKDAIIGHRQAWEKAGVLHRDISLGNILIVDKPREGSYKGFVHDFDYSAMTADPVTGLVDDMPRDDDAEDGDLEGSDNPPGGGEFRKERTGTFYFMALELLLMFQTHLPVIHDVHHDLEGVYWVLLWIVLRHTNHTLGQSRCAAIFIHGRDEEAFSAKQSWLASPFQDNMPAWKLVIKDNAPLTTLLQEFKILVRKQCTSLMNGSAKDYVITYDMVLPLFEKALASDGWPEDDWVECTLLDNRERSVSNMPLLADKNPNLAAHIHTFALPAPESPTRSAQRRANAPKRMVASAPPKYVTPSWTERGRKRGSEAVVEDQSANAAGSSQREREERVSKRVRSTRTSLRTPSPPPI